MKVVNINAKTMFSLQPRHGKCIYIWAEYAFIKKSSRKKEKENKECNCFKKMHAKMWCRKTVVEQILRKCVEIHVTPFVVLNKYLHAKFGRGTYHLIFRLFSTWIMKFVHGNHHFTRFVHCFYVLACMVTLYQIKKLKSIFLHSF